ncbi:glutamate--tRNA ligase [Hyphobacterium sp.]|uniref:glutamate--tRNA ligase n=1 Tax=Hyphobacterium sp. TaxID=2004662 RepID=UPI003BAB2E4B
MVPRVQDSPGQIVTRFAPSPTGFLHIGGARTALFNWLLARNASGKFLLRIEDTDRARSTDAATQAILDGLSWLGLDWDGEPVSQFANAARHRAVVDQMLQSGGAFRCYMSAEETEAERKKAFADGRALRSPWRDRDPDDAPKGAAFTVRFKASDIDSVIADAVQGEVRWKAKDFDDLVLLRSDGSPTYNLAVVVDDHDMGVTHIVRGDDHLVNGGRQAQIYDALGWERPVFAHIPLIHGADGKKLSKRHGALGAEAYREMGYLPEGLRNYLLRLGWSHGDEEFFDDEAAIAVFSLAGLNKSPARLDLDKLAHINAHHMKLAGNGRLIDLVLPFCEARYEGDNLSEATLSERLALAMDVLKTRASTLVELADQAYFLYRPTPITLEGKAAKPLKGEAPEILGRFQQALKSLADWNDASLHEALNSFVEKEKIGFGKIGAPLRAALTGGAPAPDIALVLAWLGRDEAMKRIDTQINKAQNT